MKDDVSRAGPAAGSGHPMIGRARLADRQSPAAQALAAYDARTTDGDGGEAAERRAWVALCARLEAEARARAQPTGAGGVLPAWRWWWTWAAAGLVVTGAFLLVVAPSRIQRPEAPLAATQAGPPPVTSAAAAPAPAPVIGISLGPVAQSLRTGRNQLGDEAVVVVASEALAEVRVDPHRGGRGRGKGPEVAVTLAAGALELQVAPRPARRRFVVVAGPYRFVVLGTVFRVARGARETELWVHEGRVAVWRGERLLKTVGPAGRWTGPAEPWPVSAGLEACAELADRRRWRSAVACYGALASGSGPALELEAAFYERARLQREGLGDTRAAAETLESYRRRFPRGALRSEVDLTFVELLPRLGRHREALAESAALLERQPRHERAAELRLLRGNVLREVFAEHGAAEREYRAAQAAAAAAAGARGGAGRVVDDAAFFQAVCLEATGRVPEAVQAYRRYLARRAGAHAEQARTRLATLKEPGAPR